MSYMLSFFMDLQSSSKLLQGRMALTKNGELVDVYIATSGSVGNQDRNDTDKKARGAIPSTLDAGLKNYWVVTKAVNMPNVKGVEGLFFSIEPFSVKVNGVQRSDFGIHADANVPGSAGCIVLPPSGNGWRVFQERMRQLNQEGIKRIPLQVVYC